MKATIWEVNVENRDNRSQSYWIAAASVGTAMSKGLRYARKDFDAQGRLTTGLKIIAVRLVGTVDD